ncbi:MAG: phenylalanine--tRNA ligase subunit beta, partial [Bacteroidetes bacterium]|nr:phenylalanine--tRNA ligase subunit beta [Bacteroidota bacterium]
ELGLGDDHSGIMVLEESLAVGMPMATVFPVERDVVFEIGLTPNRADAYHHIGVARDLCAALNFRKGLQLEVKWPDISSFKEGSGYPVDVEVANSKSCPRYCGLVIEDLKIAPSPDWLQHRLKAIGQRPINNVVDITNYIMHEYGQPLHAFEMSAVNGTIKVGNLDAGTNFIALDETEYKLSEEDLMICNADSGMCIGGVFGGLNSGVSDSTTSIFLESAYFDPTSIRRTSTRHGLRTDAASHFEKGIDPAITSEALKKAAMMMQELANGKVVSDLTDIRSDEFEPFGVSMEAGQLKKIAGIEIPENEIEKILDLLDIDIVMYSDGVYDLSVPRYRVDVQREADIIEEVLRIYGFNSIPIPSKLNASIGVTDLVTADSLYEKIADFLVANGYFEILVNSITKEEYNDPEGQVKLLNNLNAELTAMRTSSMHTGLEAIRHNLNHSNKDCKFFELGKQYTRLEDGFREDEVLSLWATGRMFPSNWRHKGEMVDFYYLKSVAQNIAAILGIGKYTISEIESEKLGNAVAINSGDKVVAHIGEVHNKVLELMDVGAPVFYASFFWDVVTQLVARQDLRYKEMPRYPSMRRDLAMLVNSEVPFAAFEKIGRKHGKNILREMDLFDVYQDKKMEAGKKSYAISHIFRDDHKTLSDKEVDKIMNRLMEAYTRELQVVIR